MHRRWWDFEEPLPVVMACLAQGLGTETFYDVGANTGFYSVLVGNLAPHVHIRSFEPVDWIADQCRENLSKHGVEATMVEVALSDTPGTATMYFPPDDHGLIETSASLNADFNPVNMRVMEVSTARRDLGGGIPRVSISTPVWAVAATPDARSRVVRLRTQHNGDWLFRWPGPGSNRRPSAFQADARTN